MLSGDACVVNTLAPRISPPQNQKSTIINTTSAIRWCAEDFDYKYSQLKVPVQVVQSTHRGEGNKRVPVTSDMHIEWHHELKTLGVDAEFDLVADCGHFTMLDKPEVVNTNIERLLERIEAAAAQYSSASAQ